MKTTLSILLCKFISFVCSIFKRDGSVFPGSIVYKFDKKALWKIKYPKTVIIVTGSSGKGSTVSMLNHILEEADKKVVLNKNGSNTNNAVMTLLLNNTKCFSHKVNADVVIMEMDERYIKGVFKPGTISHMVITNVTRDQPARNIHPESVFNAIMSAVDENIHLIFNDDDVLLNRIKYKHKGKFTTYGMAKTKYSSKEVPNYAVDGAYCPRCHNKLIYDAYHYGHLGIYACPHCDFQRGKVDYEGSSLDLKVSTFKINDDILKLNKAVFFAAYYTLAAYTAASIIGIKREVILSAINNHMISSKRGKSYNLGERKIEMLESKNENALSYLQSLTYIKNQEGKKTVIMGFENVSRRYSFNDLSWLWDVDFELLNDDNVDKIFCIGRFNYDVATRLYYAGIEFDKIILVDDITKLLDMVSENSCGNIYSMVCFDMTEIITNMLKERAQ